MNKEPSVFWLYNPTLDKAIEVPKNFEAMPIPWSGGKCFELVEALANYFREVIENKFERGYVVFIYKGTQIAFSTQSNKEKFKEYLNRALEDLRELGVDI